MKRVFAIVLVSILALTACSTSGTPATSPAAPAEPSVAAPAESVAEGAKYAVIGRATGNPYVEKSMAGFEEGVKEFGGTSILRAPDQVSAEAQIPMIEELVAQGVVSIALASNDANALEPVLQKAMSKDVKILSFDSPASPDGRMTHINQADPELIGRVEIQAIAEMINYEGEIAILSATSTSDNQNIWIDWMKEELKDPKYSKMNLVKVAYGDDLRDKSVSETEALLKTYPELKGIIAPTTVGIAAAGKVLTDKGLKGQVMLTGLGLPSEMAEYIENGVCPWMYLWNPIDIGYLSAYASKAMAEGKITGAVGDKFDAGRLGEKEVTQALDGGTEVLLGPPFKFDSENIGEWKNVY